MKYKYCKDCIRVKLNKSEYEALVHLVSLSMEYWRKKSIEDACKCAEMAYFLFIEGTFKK